MSERFGDDDHVPRFRRDVDDAFGRLLEIHVPVVVHLRWTWKLCLVGTGQGQQPTITGKNVVEIGEDGDVVAEQSAIVCFHPAALVAVGFAGTMQM